MVWPFASSRFVSILIGQALHALNFPSLPFSPSVPRPFLSFISLPLCPFSMLSYLPSPKPMSLPVSAPTGFPPLMSTVPSSSFPSFQPSTHHVHILVFHRGAFTGQSRMRQGSQKGKAHIKQGNIKETQTLQTRESKPTQPHLHARTGTREQKSTGLVSRGRYLIQL